MTHFYLRFRLFLCALCLATATSVVAQQPQQGPPTGRTRPPISGTITGSLYDVTTDGPVQYAQVAALSVRDSTAAAAALTDTAGYFKLENLPRGTYILKLSFFGQTIYSQRTHAIDANGIVVDLGTLRVTPPTPTTEEVEITASAPDVVFAPDRRIYNVDKMITAVGGTATDVLTNIPSVTVDIDGNVELRGSGNVVIWIDGKPSGLTSSDRGSILQMIPASLIERVEVITNPSSKYDAEGQAGIINIVTKRGALVGTNGNVQLSAGTREKYTSSVFLNKRTVKYNLSASLSARSQYRFSRGSSEQFTTFSDTSYSNLNYSNGTDRGTGYNGRLGFDWYFSPTTTLALTASGGLRDDTDRSSTRYENRDEEGTVVNPFTRISDRENIDHNYDFSAEYKQVLPTGKQWSASASYGSNQGDDFESLVDDISDTDGLPYQTSDNQTRFTNVLGQVDFVQPLVSGAKVEFGAKGTVRINDREVLTRTYDLANDTYFTDSRNTDRFKYTEEVYAGYVQYSGKVKSIEGLEYSLGVRGEQTFTAGESRTLAQTNTREFFNLFPSVFFKYTPSEGFDVILNYSRRVSRPRLNAVNPFLELSDTLNVRQGNPNLQPEFTNSYEFSVNRVAGRFTLSGTVFYRRTTNATSNYRTIDPETGVGTTTFLNLASSDNVGVESNIRARVGNLSSITLAGNAFYSQLNPGTGNPSDASNDGINWNLRLIGAIALDRQTFIQLTGFYFHPFVRAQGTVGGFSSVNAGIRRDFFSRKLTVNLNVSDVFDIRQFELTSFTPTFAFETVRKRESRIATLSVTYNFGRPADNQQRRNQRRGQGDFGGEGGEGGAPGGGDFSDF